MDNKQLPFDIQLEWTAGRKVECPYKLKSIAAVKSGAQKKLDVKVCNYNPKHPRYDGFGLRFRATQRVSDYRYLDKGLFRKFEK